MSTSNVQRGGQQDAHSDADSTEHGASASNAVNETAAPNGLTRKPNPGWFKPGHKKGRLETGIYSDRLPPGLEYVAGEVERFNVAAMVDEGCEPQDIPARRRSQLAYRGVLHRNILAVAGALEQRGLIDKRGKLRVAWISKLESLISTAVRIDNLLGLERRTKDANSLDLPINEYVAQQRDRDQGGH